MANLTISLKSQVVRFLGPSPSTKWNTTFRWTAAGVGPGNGTWGIKSAGTAASLPIYKNLFRTLTGSSQIIVSSPVNIPHNVNKVLSQRIGMVYSNVSGFVRDGRGDYYVFVDRVTDFETRSFASFTSSVAGTVSYASQAVASTTWSQV